MKKYIIALLITLMANCSVAGVYTNEITEKINNIKPNFSDFYKNYQSNRAVGGVTTVGADGACAFSSIQDAINSGADEIRIATNMIYNDKLILTGMDIVIRGGFSDCTQALMNNQSSNLAIIDHTGLNFGAIIAISGSNQRSSIILENLRLTGAISSGIETTSANAEVLLNNVHIDNNHLTSGAGGGGISINLGDTDFMLVDSIVSQNSAEFGGGINCVGTDASISIRGESGVSQNFANGTLANGISGSGGGAFITAGCEMIVYSGTQDVNAQTLLGISNNQANANGGGVYVSQGGTVLLSGHRSKPTGGMEFFGSDSTPANLNNNVANINNSGDGGGGAYVVDAGSFLIITAGLIKDNISTNGGGLYSKNDGTLFVTRTEKKCWNPDRCSFFQGNIAKDNSNGGAAYNDFGRILFTNSYFEENQAGLGTAIFVKNGGVNDNRIHGSVFNHNSKSDNGLNDKYVIRLEQSRMEVYHSTFADNNVDEAVFGIKVDASLRLVSSIVHESSGLVATTAASSNSIISGCLIVHDITNIPVGVVADPQFVDRNNRDYHLNVSLSPAIDFCLSQSDVPFGDIDFEPRGWDYPNVNSPFDNGQPLYFYDIGADEVYDIIFINGFE